ncbi:ATP-binding protein [Psychromarinibacter halotolerans]|uniref:ATP-binding protein n=1 Tax=Psychromarinibacter halotolerans TaxID=1775175 RepID=A0ABV7GPL8_9RHOB|nr:ATP-binding protein [Psychromarinibacter halotolerans]MDF0598738.1 ATP-binding protein [Psychromarinibacter halotolerans]
MYHRHATQTVQSALDAQSAVVLLGPRQVGKTTLALEIAGQRPSVYLDLERDADRRVLTEPDLYLDEQVGKLVIIDEVQQMPDLFKTLRGQIDMRRRKGARTGQFLLLGSASNVLLHQSAESLAGRVRYIEMPPLLLDEVGEDRMNDLWLRGGFPDSFQADSDQNSLAWREDFLRTYLERDIPALGPRIPAATLRRFWTMLAHAQGGLLNAAALAEGLGVSGQTVGRYLDLLVDLMLVRRLQPRHENAGKRLVKSPKVFVRDSGLVHALLGLGSLESVLGHPVIGGSWEGFCIETLIAAAPIGTEPFFYRTSAGAELDLVLRFPSDTIWAIEIKRTTTPKVSRGFHLSVDDIKADRKILVYAGEREVPAGDGLRAMPLATAVEQLRNL